MRSQIADFLPDLSPSFFHTCLSYAVRGSGKENLTCDNLFALLALTHVKAPSNEIRGLNPNCPRPILSPLATEMPSRLSWISVRFGLMDDASEESVVGLMVLRILVLVVR